MSSALQLALLSCALLGLRHGFDYDHLAAITDITSVQRNWREGMRLGVLYALGHALTVAVLGVTVLALHLSLPTRMDALGERAVGATLIVLALYVLVSFLRTRGSAHTHPRSRVALLITAVQRLVWLVRRRLSDSVQPPQPFAFQYDRSSVFAVGVVHGLGAETPSQLMLFLLAANLGGTSRGLLGLGCFLVGLVAMNTLMTASASGLFAGSTSRPRVHGLLTTLTVAYSFCIGVIFLFGISDRLPALVR
ncbi:MAG: hypothetical protein KGK08_08915 [Acidobacteriota bacterium]|nr:hypothetical protein [Acidobacteriota bacterium]